MLFSAKFFGSRCGFSPTILQIGQGRRQHRWVSGQLGRPDVGRAPALDLRTAKPPRQGYSCHLACQPIPQAGLQELRLRWNVSTALVISRISQYKPCYTRYLILSRERLQEIWRTSGLQSRKWRSEIFDCDNFSFGKWSLTRRTHCT